MTIHHVIFRFNGIFLTRTECRALLYTVSL